MARATGPVGRPRPVPQRTCAACREGRSKRDLVRVVRTVDGRVEIDPTGKKVGRGAYLCNQSACWSAGLARGGLARALKIERVAEADLATLESYAARVANALAAVAEDR